MLQLGTVLINAEYEPPRPAITPKRRVTVWRQQVGSQPEYVEDWGMQAHQLVRFASSASQGFVTGAQLVSLQSLYEAGGTFALTTDLLKTHGGTADVYTARFDPDGDPPVFTPATPGGDLYYFDFTLMIQ